MADNIPVNPSSAGGRVNVATDEIGGIHYPIYKVSFGALGSQTPVDASNPLPVSSSLEADEKDIYAMLLESQDKILVQLEILNAYMAEGFDFKITEEDLL